MLCEKILLYEGREDVTLTTYVLDDSPEMLNGKKRGAVIICPGGGYLSCSDREGEPIAMAFAAMGYHAFVLRYSVYSKGTSTLPKPGEPQIVREHSVFPNPMLDIGRAMLYIREHSEEWLVDMEKVAVCGFSAGAHNSAMYSVYWNKPIMTDHFGVDPEMLRPAACILGYTLSDYVFMREAVVNCSPLEQMLHKLIDTAFLGNIEHTEENLKKISPALLVDENTPPTFLWATCEDTLVPVQHSTHMATALANHKIPFEIHIFESGIHGLSTATQSSSGSLVEMDGDAAKWLKLCEAWLYKRFAFDLPRKGKWEI